VQDGQPVRESNASAGINTPVRDGKFEFVVTGAQTGLTQAGDNPFLDTKPQGQVQRRTAHTQILRDVPAGVTVGLHPLGGRDVLAVVHFAGPSESGAVGARRCTLERSTLLGQLPLVFSQEAEHATSRYLEPVPDRGIASTWQRCDLSGDGQATAISVDEGEPILLATEGLRRQLGGLRALGIGAADRPHLAVSVYT
jgi:hypothetical protein